MKVAVLLLAVLLYVAVVKGRNLHDTRKNEEKQENDHSNSEMRHRRPPRHSYYDHSRGYNPYDDYYGRRIDDRREYYSRQDELLSRIMRELEELSVYVRKTSTPPPPPPPQIIYVPVPYPVPQCFNQNNTTVPSLITRFLFDDKNRNWGALPGVRDVDIGGDGSRPINLDPVESNEPTVKPPPVDHGSRQAGTTTAKPISEPGRCKASILVCCQDTSDEERKECFTNYGCPLTYSIGISCHPEVVKIVIAEFAEAYSPINKT